MSSLGLAALQAEVKATQLVKWIGRVNKIGRGSLQVSGLSQTAALGDLVNITPANHAPIRGEVLELNSDYLTVLPDGEMNGVQINDRVTLLGGDSIAPHDSWIGRIIDPYGKALDGKPTLRGLDARPLRAAPFNPTERRSLGSRLETGLAVFNTFLPIVRGQRIGLFAGSGVGKSTLLGKLATGLQADLVVVAMIGERGREVREFAQRILGSKGMQRAIIVAATSDQSALTRRRCAWAAMAVAEHFRDQGCHVLFIADSITRFAQAHREVALAVGEPATLGGFPPSTAHMITALCERAGPGAGTSSDITAIFSVLVAGSDMEEPIADILRGVLDGHVVLERKIAERGRFPAIDLLRSVSRALPLAASDAENQKIMAARRLLGIYDEKEVMIQAGLYTKGSDDRIDAAIQTWPGLDDFIAQSEFGNIQDSFRRLQECLELDSQTDTQEQDGEAQSP